MASIQTMLDRGVSIRDFHALISGSIWSVMALIVSAETRFPRFSSIQSLISRVLLLRAYRPIIRLATPFARMVSCFLMNWGSKLELRSRGVETGPHLMEFGFVWAFYHYGGTRLTFFICQMRVNFTFQSCIQYTFH